MATPTPISALPISASGPKAADILMIDVANVGGGFTTSRIAVSVLASWAAGLAPVQSVAGRAGNVTLSSGDISDFASAVASILASHGIP